MTQLIEPPARATATPASKAESSRLGLPQSTALVMGSIIGVGIFSLPYAIASYGPISLVAMALATVGAVALALMFAVLSRRIPAEGGPYAYARAAFGNGFGFSQAWLYWITAWAGNAAIAVGWVFYVQLFLNKGGSTLGSIAIALVGLWIPAAVNLTGVRNMGVFQLWTTVLKFVPAGPDGHRRPAVHQGRQLHALEHQRRHQPLRHRRRDGDLPVQLPGCRDRRGRRRQGPRPRAQRARSPRSTEPSPAPSSTCSRWSRSSGSCRPPFSPRTATRRRTPQRPTQIAGGTWLGYIVAVAVVISGLGALNGWTMICAEMPLAAAKDGLFPRALRLTVQAGRAGLRDRLLDSAGLGRRGDQLPGRQRGHGLHHPGPDDGHHLRHPVRRLRARPAQVAPDGPQAGATPHFALDVGVAVVALVMSLAFVWYSRNSGADWYVVWGPFLMAGGAALLGIPVYLSQRGSMTEPTPVPEYK